MKKKGPLHEMNALKNVKILYRKKNYARRVDFSVFFFILSSNRHSYIGLVFNSRFLDS
jgi:hypothetical protein